MKHLVISVLLLAVLGSASTTWADNCDTAFSDRFDINNDGTVTELPTGLTWMSLMVFPNTPPQIFWTSYTTPANNEYAYTFSVGAQGVDASTKNAAHYMRLMSAGCNEIRDPKSNHT